MVAINGWRYPLSCTQVGFRVYWWAAVDSNHLPPRYQHGALPVELAAQFQQGYSPERNRANRNSTMGTNRPYAAFGSRPVSPRRRSCSGASSATATLGGNAPIC